MIGTTTSPAAGARPPFEKDNDDAISDAVTGRNGRGGLFHKGELSFGVVLGFCTGYLIKKVGKLFALAVGAGFVFLQVKFGAISRDRLHGRIHILLVHVDERIRDGTLG